ncbi:MAG: hypothetical protein SFY80_12765 [Verrucomicrobiota bacterium]|nr:hypothetical protein [Verrucomicrobiota bacterium]
MKRICANSFLRHRPSLRLVSKTLVWVACLAQILSAVAFAILPQTRILNQASGEYIDPLTAESFPLLSNIVEVQVGVSPGILLEEDRSIIAAPGAVISLSHRLTNSGNTAANFTVDLSVATAEDFQLEDARLWWDANENGIPDTGEALLASASRLQRNASLTSVGSIHLIAGESIALIITGRVPVTAANGETTRLNLSASNAAHSLTATNRDTITVNDVPAMIIKSVAPGTAKRQDELTWTINFTSVNPLLPVGVRIDGTGAQRVIVRDAIPANTTFARFGALNGAQALYHTYGTDLHIYTTNPPSDLREVDAVAWGFTETRAGQLHGLSFITTINSNASGNIPNTASLHFQKNTAVELLASNRVEVTVPLAPPIIRYFTTTEFTRIAPITSLGRLLHVQADAATCNLDPLVIEEVTIGITSKLTGDEESYTAIETGANSGVFRIIPSVPTADANKVQVTRRNGTIESLVGDMLTAYIRECGGTLSSTTILVDPRGVVFDSRTNEPIRGAKVTLIDVTGEGNGGRPGQAAAVLDLDFITKAPSTVTTGNDGIFHFPLVERSHYLVTVTPPDGYKFPSVVPAILLDPSRLIDSQASYGGQFLVNEDIGAVFFDVPLDPMVAPGFQLTKEVSRSIAEIGDSVIYTLELKNTTPAIMRSVFLDDHLPAGFHYERGSARIAGRAIDDPLGGAGPDLKFYFGHLAVGQKIVLQYRVRLAPGAQRGSGINRAQAVSLGPPKLFSNEARAQVRVEEGVFTDKGVLFGRVFIDNDGDSLPGEKDLGVPGVRIYLEDGTNVITDVEGKYSIYGLRPVAHAVKVDPFSLPQGAVLVPIDTRNAGDEDLRFADMKNGELHKSNFAIKPSPSVLAEVNRRREQAHFIPEVRNTLDRDLRAEARAPLLGDTKALPARGTVGSQKPNLTFQPLLPTGTLTSGNSNLPPRPVDPIAAIDLSIYAGQIVDPTPAILDLADGDTLPMAITNVRVKGNAATTFQLLLNGEPVSRKRVGKSIENPATQIRFEEYIGLNLHSGANRIEFIQTDSFGNPRGGQSITVIAPDELAQIRVEFDRLDPIADGATPLRLTVYLEDKNGNPVTARTPITLESDYGRWVDADLNPGEPGAQVFLNGGKGEYSLLPSGDAGTAHLVVSCGLLLSEQQVRFQPQMRPFVVSGIAEGRVNFNSGDTVPGDGGVTKSSKATSPFEDVVSEIDTFDDGSVTGRVSAFAKGEVKKGWLLTASYDSAKESGGTLFRDIEPDAFYPVYGDDSIRGFDAQSTSKVYAKLENKNNYLLYGDFTTQTQTNVNALDNARALGAYNRSLTGVQSHYENDRVTLNTFAAYTSSRRVVMEIPGNGTSGPFNIAPMGGGLRNTETIEVLVRDRNQPGLIIDTRTLARFSDYEFEPFTGRLLLRTPLASLDSNGNTQSLRISYELENETGDKSWVWGLDGTVKILSWWEVGGSYVEDQNPLEQYTLSSANTTIKLAEKTFLIGEVARSESLVEGQGMAGRVELRHSDSKTDARVYAGKAEADFKNPTSMLTAGRVEAGFDATRKLAPNTTLKTEGIYSQDVATSGNRKGVRADVAHTLQNKVTVEVGGRVSEETDVAASTDTVGATPNSVRSARVKVSTPVPMLPAASVYGEVENDVVDTDKRIVAFGGDYQVKAKTRVYARHELVDSLGGEFQINSIQQNNRTLVGVESEYMRDGQLFNEYRVRDSISSREAEAATGLRNKWDVGPGFDLNTSFERTTPFDGKQERESTAATAAIAYTEKNDWKGTARVEVRFADASDSFLNTLGYARKLDPAWTFLARTIYYQLNSSGEDARDMQQARLLTGLAYRPVKNDTWNALFRYELKYEDGSLDFDDAMTRTANIGSLSWNWQPCRSFILSSRYAAKYVEENRALGDSNYFGQMLGGRALLDVTKRIDVGLSASINFNGASDRYEYALGPEVGLNFKKNMRLAVGYNFYGYEDRDFEDLAYSRSGLFITLRLKFDENFFRDLWGSDDKADKEGGAR